MLEQLRELNRALASDVESAYAQAAEGLLTGSQFLVGGETCRVLEIEFYLYCSKHPDPFAHRHPIQGTFGRWYFHRVGSGYRGGSFKGIDITFGNDDCCFGGILIRTIESPHKVICGPSLCVDFMLNQTGHAKPEQLDVEIGKRDAWDASSPLHFRPSTPKQEPLYRCARVGLSTKGLSDADAPEQFIDRHYRFLIEPQKIKKGRPELIRGLSIAGYSLQEIHALTGSPRKSIERHADRK